MLATPTLAVAWILGQSEAPDTSSSDPVVFIVGIILVTVIAVIVVARQRRSGK